MRKALRAWLLARALLLAVLLAPTLRGQPAATPSVTAPRLETFVEAKLPAGASFPKANIQVELELTLDTAGRVSRATVTGSAGEPFDSAAVDAAQRFVFSPAEVDGHPVSVRIRYQYVFLRPSPVAGALGGVVIDGATGEPVAGALVSLDDAEPVKTADDGRFEFREVEPGERRLSISTPSGARLDTLENIVSGQRLDVRYRLEDEPPDDEEQEDLVLEIRAPKLRRDAVSTKVDSGEARRAAGTQGDVLKVIQNLPGVGKAATGSGEVVVWGAAPGDTRVYVDAVRLPALYHFGGLRSVLHSRLVRSVELVPGAYGAPHGRGLGGLVRVELERPTSDWHGAVQADVLDASLALTGPLADDTTFQIAGRRSHLRALMNQVVSARNDEYFTIPSYHDGALRVRHGLSASESLEFGGMLSSDSQSRSRGTVDPARLRFDQKALDFQRVDVRYVRTGSDGELVTLQPWLGRDVARRSAGQGDVQTLLETRSWLLGFRGEIQRPLSAQATARVGVDLEAVQTRVTRSGSAVSPAREGDPYVFGRAPADQLNADEFGVTSLSAAPYIELEWSLAGGALTLVPGLRLDPQIHSVERRVPTDAATPPVGAQQSDLDLQPRLAIEYRASERVTFKAAGGRYSQAPAPEDWSAVFGTPTLGMAYGTSWLAGWAVEPLDRVSAETTLFLTRGRSLASRDGSQSPLVSRALIQSGTSRAHGLQLLLRVAPRGGKTSGWIAYTLLRSERSDDAGRSYRAFDLDQTHVLTAIANQDLGAGFDLGFRFRVASGMPRTPVVGAYFDARRQQYEPLLGATNSTRLPATYQLDARLSKTFGLGWSQLEVYLDVQNVTNRRNPEEVVYSADYAEHDYITGLPIFPVLGAEWTF
ncbi:MAG: TonB-dependent receptor [Polyangiaceae bacterium]